MIAAPNISNPRPRKVVYARRAATNQDIRALMPKMAKIAARQLSAKAKEFRGLTEMQTARNIWEFLKNQITYLEDGDDQIIKAPSALLRERTGDCKSYAVFTSGILSALGIKHKLVFASYNSDPTPTHVYIKTNSGILIDAVYSKFNAEKKATYKYFKQMNLQGITGTGQVTGTEKDKNKHAAAVILMAPARFAFLTMLKLNVFGIASVLNLKSARSWANGKNEFLDELGRICYNVGWDNSKKVQEAWAIGRYKKAVGINLMAKIPKNKRGKYANALLDAKKYYASKGIDISKVKGQRGIGVTGVEEAAAVVASVPVWILILDVVLKNIPALSSGQEGDFSETFGENYKQLELEPDPKPDLIPGISNTTLLIGGGIAAAVLYFLFKKK